MVAGLPMFHSFECTLLANRGAIDDWLLCQGAERIPVHEMPHSYYGIEGALRDRIPYGCLVGEIDYDGNLVKNEDQEAFRAWVKVNEPGRFV